MLEKMEEIGENGDLACEVSEGNLETLSGPFVIIFWKVFSESTEKLYSRGDQCYASCWHLNLGMNKSHPEVLVLKA